MTTRLVSAVSVTVGAVGALVLTACGGGEAKSASNRYQADPNDSSASSSSSSNSSGSSSSGSTASGTPSSGGSSCADKTGDTFSKCASSIYGEKKYGELVSTCKTAIKHPSHSESEKSFAAGICIRLLPSALFLSGNAGEARDLLAIACKGSNDADRTNTAAQATLITMLGMGKGDNGDKIKAAVITFATACDVEPGRVADRAVELSKQ